MRHILKLQEEKCAELVSYIHLYLLVFPSSEELMLASSSPS